MDFTWLPAAGSSGAALLVMYFALKYISQRDQDLKEIVKMTADVSLDYRNDLDKVRSMFVEEIRLERSQNKELMDLMFSVQKDTASSMNALGARVAELAIAIQEMRALVKDTHPPAPASVKP